MRDSPSDHIQSQRQSCQRESSDLSLRKSEHDAFIVIVLKSSSVLSISLSPKCQFGFILRSFALQASQGLSDSRRHKGLDG